HPVLLGTSVGGVMVQSALRFKCRGLQGAWRPFWIVALLSGFAGCGGGNGVPPPSETVGTLAYALTECRDTPDGFFERQELHVRHGDRDTIVFQTPEVGPVTGIGRLCLAITRQRAGINSVAREAIQEIAVSPDGSTVAFEINTDFSMLPTLPLQLPAD